MFYSKRYETEVRKQCEQSLLKAFQNNDKAYPIRRLTVEEKYMPAEEFMEMYYGEALKVSDARGIKIVESYFNVFCHATAFVFDMEEK